MDTRQKVVAAVLTVVCCGVPASRLLGLTNGEPEWNEQEVRRQVSTRARMQRMALMLESFRVDQKPYPMLLADVWAGFPADERQERDAWEHPFYYYSTGSHYVLISFGRGGQPRLQRWLGIPPEVDYDTNLVCIDGEFSQMPRDVDQ